MAESILSSPVADNQPIKAADYNNLRHDVLHSTEGHQHDSFGGTVDHGDLSESGVISGRECTHGNIDTHINGSSGSFADDPGGDQGVHGLSDLAYILGSIGDSYGSPKQGTIQWGTGQTDTTTTIGTKVEQTTTSNVTFPRAFSNTPVVFIMCNDSESARLAVASVSTTGFKPYIGFAVDPHASNQHDTPFSWIAVEVMS